MKKIGLFKLNAKAARVCGCKFKPVAGERIHVSHPLMDGDHGAA